jgi:hypothetical protein
MCIALTEQKITFEKKEKAQISEVSVSGSIVR